MSNTNDQHSSARDEGGNAGADIMDDGIADEDAHAHRLHHSGGTLSSNVNRFRVGPYEKWVRHGKFPFKLVIHIMLIAATTTQAIVSNHADAAYFRAAERNWYYYFFPQAFDFQSKSFYLYNRNETIDSVRSAMHGLELITETSVDRVNLTYEQDGSCGRCKSGLLRVRAYVDFFQDKKTTSEYWITEHDIGPLDLDRYSYEQVSKFLHRLDYMELELGLTTRNNIGCLDWKIVLHYDFQSRGQIALSLSSSILRSCSQAFTARDFMQHWFWLNILIAFLAIGFFILNTRSLIKSLRMAIRHKISRNRASTVPENIASQGYEPLTGSGVEETGTDAESVESTASSKFESFWGTARKFVNPWIISTSIATTCNIVHVGLNIVTNTKHSPTTLFHKLVMGLGCALLWISLIAYFAHNEAYFSLVNTLNRAVPRVFRFLVGVIPVFLGYTFFGMLYFGDKSEVFGTVSDSMITLFSVLNGDVIRETFMELIALYPVVTQLYLYSFICLFIYVVLNVFIAIVEESFFATRAKARSMEEFAKDFQNDSGNNQFMAEISQLLSDANLEPTPDGNMSSCEIHDPLPSHLEQPST